jgi:hypothetical protein
VTSENLTIQHLDRLRVGGGHTRQGDVEVSPSQIRISPSMQRVLSVCPA